MKSSALVVFEKDLPGQNEKWWERFNVVIAPATLEAAVKKLGVSFVNIETLMDPGSVHEASELTRKLSLTKNADGKRLTKILSYQGFELWWIYYDYLMYRFSLPYTEYRRLLAYLMNFSEIYLHQPPFPDLFRYFLDSHGRKYSIRDKFNKKFSLGILLQAVASIPFLLCLKIKKPRLMVWTSDQFSPGGDYDFRMKFIYEELRKRKIEFVEFIRSMEPASVVIRHAFSRKRPVIYSYAVITVTRAIANLAHSLSKRTKPNLKPAPGTGAEELFWFRVASHYLHNAIDEIWSIRVMVFVMKFIGIRSAIIPTVASRNFHEVLACKLSGITMVGIQHGASLKYHAISDFMPEFDGERSMSVDKYGLWSDWWKEYYANNSKIYRPEQLYVSGPMRPLEVKPNYSSAVGSGERSGPIKVLFLSEQLAAFSEVMPYLSALLEAKNVSVYMTFRPYRDGFEEWLNENHHNIIKKIDREKIFRGNIHKAIAECDVAVGSMSAGVLEALLMLKPFIFFRTNKWGDYYELKAFDSAHHFFAENPMELLAYIQESGKIPQAVLKRLQERFFGDPYRNGSKWVVEEAAKHLGIS